MDKHLHAEYSRAPAPVRIATRNVLILLGMLTALFVLYAEANAAAPEFIGIKSCTKCHKKKKEGEQLAIWEKSKHSKAYETLGTPKAKDAAKKAGVSGNPQKSGACLVCHTTGFGEPAARFDKKFKMEQGVQCEACHGAGDNFKKKKIMKQIAKERGPDKKGDSPTAKKMGLIFPDENTCKRCHAEQIEHGGKVFKNPNHKPFDFKASFDKIKHPIPR
jgi:hypothetical protein